MPLNPSGKLMFARTVPASLAVGDGNHSPATAKAVWEEYRRPTDLQEKRLNVTGAVCLIEIKHP